jgi:hypothetical protein
MGKNRMYNVQTLESIIGNFNANLQCGNLNIMGLVTTFDNYNENNQNNNIVVGFLIAPKDAEKVNTDILPNLDYWYYRTGNNLHIYCLGYYSRLNQYNENTEPLVSVHGQNWYYNNEVFVNEVKKLEKNCNYEYNGEIDLILLPLSLENNQYKINYKNVNIYYNLVQLCNQNNALSIRSWFEKFIKKYGI